MQIIERQTSTLKYMSIEPDHHDLKSESPLIILLHGYGSNMRDLAGFCPVLGEEYVYVCPNAPLDLSANFGFSAFAWMEISNDNLGIEQSEKLLTYFLDDILDHYGSIEGDVPIFVGGFSQGAVIAYRWGLNNPNIFDGIFALSGKLILSENFSEMESKPCEQVIFVAHGESDLVIPVRYGRQAKEYLRAHGYDLEYREHDMTHEISELEVKDLKRWIASKTT